MDAIVLAGGLSTRLWPITKELPKPMLPVGGRPFLEYVLDLLLDGGIKTIYLSVGHKKEAIEKHFGYKYKGIPLIYSLEDEPLDTGGAVSRALSKLSNQNFFIVNGDTLFKINYREMWNDHILNNRLLTIAVKFMVNYSRYGSVHIDEDGIILKFNEKRMASEGLINGGIYIANRQIFLEADLPPKFSFEKDLIEPNIESLRPGAYKTDGYFIDIGVFEDYEKAQKELWQESGN